MKKFKWFEKKVDERQERDIMEVEHIGFWAMYYMLLAAIIIQAFFVEGGEKHLVGEFVVFMVTSVIVLAGWMRKGVPALQHYYHAGIWIAFRDCHRNQGGKRLEQHSGRYGDYNALHLYRMFCGLYDYWDDNEKAGRKAGQSGM